ncbi:hypothetical protein [Rhodococcoides yunnanense]|uniref:Uncharacterized protein n=1 Tax=Rhodococcoides yunnanense TaxID=278209 RepID=A0ABU4B8C3_9NOCA|nr:hypothetical protein [Rhodococcus yunnanensis]MDV6260393.1 hypothetical protein [Rhodococcus yunnanensis]
MAERVYLEYRLNENVIFVLDHRTVDVFDAAVTVASGGRCRWHVDQLGVDAKQTRRGTKLTIGLRTADGGIHVNGDRMILTVTDEQLPQLMAFFDRTKAARTLSR